MTLLPFSPDSGAAAFGAGLSAAARPRFGSFRRPAPDTALMFSPTPDSPLLIEALPTEAAGCHAEAWADLVTRALEPNVFLEPSFALSAGQHFAPAERPTFIMVWRLQANGRRELLAVCPLTRSRGPLRWTTSVWFHDLSTLGAPLLDARHAGVALQAVLAWIADRMPGCGALMVHALRADGATAQVLASAAASTGRRLHTLDRRQRAALITGEGRRPAGLAALSNKRAKEVARQRRRLADHGAIEYKSANEGEDLREAVEQFLRLEAKGWKGARGTAMVMQASRAAFARSMTRLLAREGKCRVDSLALNGTPVASGIILSSGAQQFFWKMAYDEDYASVSPGVQFVLGLTEAQHRSNVAFTDSCAVPDHPMIDRLWPERLPIMDALVAVVPGAPARFTAIVAAETARRRIRISLKQGVARLRSR